MAGIKLGKGWANLSAALKPGAFTKKLKQEVAKATALNGMIVAREIRTTIKDTVDPGNMPLTEAIKGSDKPLVDKGALWKAITSKNLTWQVGFAGIMRGRKGGDGDLVNVAAKLHEGFSMRVTDSMRGMFDALAGASKSGDPSKLTGRALQLWDRTKGTAGFLKSANAQFWLPLNPATKVITVKRRPFVEMTMQTPGLREKLRKNWADAVQRAISPKGI